MINCVNKLGTISVGCSNPVRIMGILNTSPESFYKKSISISKQKIIDTVNRMQEEGADFIDIGGMSTAPYLSTMITEKMELVKKPFSCLSYQEGKIFYLYIIINYPKSKFTLYIP